MNIVASKLSKHQMIMMIKSELLMMMMIKPVLHRQLTQSKSHADCLIDKLFLLLRLAEVKRFARLSELGKKTRCLITIEKSELEL